MSKLEFNPDDLELDIQIDARSDAARNVVHSFACPMKHLYCNDHGCLISPDMSMVDPPSYLFEYAMGLAQRLEFRDLYLDQYQRALEKNTRYIRRVCKVYHDVLEEFKYKYAVCSTLSFKFANEERGLIEKIKNFII